jgi:hypothetical protein
MLAFRQIDDANDDAEKDAVVENDDAEKVSFSFECSSQCMLHVNSPATSLFTIKG